MSEPIKIEGAKKKNWKDGLFTALIIGGVLLLLAVIALPDFLKNESHPPMQSEAKWYLSTIFTTQVAYFGETDTFGSGPHCFEIIGWTPEGRNKYSYYCGEDKIKCVNCKVDCPYPNLSMVDETGFTVMAVGNIDNDDDCDVWTINDAKVLKNIRSDL